MRGFVQALIALGLSGATGSAQSLTRQVGIIKTGIATLTISATNKYRVVMRLDDGRRLVEVDMPPQTLEPFLSQVDSVARLPMAQPKASDVISFDPVRATVGITGNSDEGYVLYFRRVTSLTAAQHTIALKDITRAEALIIFTNVQLGEFARFARRAMKLADSLTT